MAFFFVFEVSWVFEIKSYFCKLIDCLIDWNCLFNGWTKIEMRNQMSRQTFGSINWMQRICDVIVSENNMISEDDGTITRFFLRFAILLSTWHKQIILLIFLLIISYDVRIRFHMSINCALLRRCKVMLTPDKRIKFQSNQLLRSYNGSCV